MKYVCLNCGQVIDNGRPQRCPKCNYLLAYLDNANYLNTKLADNAKEEVKPQEGKKEEVVILPQQQEPEKKKRRGWLIALLIIIILLLLALLSWQFIKNRNNGGNEKPGEATVEYDLQLMKDLNKILVADRANGAHRTMYSALACVKAKGFNVPQINLSGIDHEILWDSVNDVFCYLEDGQVKYLPDYPKANEVKDSELWVTRVVSSSSDLSDKYATYLTSYTGSGELVIKNSVDTGDTTNVNKISYTNETEEARTIIIRTSVDSTDMVINAPNDVVKHYDKVGYVEIQAVATSSYHEYGEAKLINIALGRVSLEKHSHVVGIHFSAKDEDEDGYGEEFEEITVYIAEDVEIPTFYRDKVVIDEEEGIKVCTVEDDSSSQDIYLFLQGIYEQVVVQDNEAKDWIDQVETTTDNTKKVAHDICNSIQGADVSINEVTREIIVEEGQDVADLIEETGTVVEETIEKVEFKVNVAAYVSNLDVSDLGAFDLYFNSQFKERAYLDVAYTFNAFEEADQELVDAFLNAKYSNGELVFSKYIEDYANQDKIDYALGVLAKEKGQEARARFEALLENRTKYLTWNADFEISFDGDIEAGSVALAGYYGAFAENYYDNNWLGFGVSNLGETKEDISDVQAGDKIRLLATMYKVYNTPDFFMNYAAICGYVKEFSCGVTNLSDANTGKTITVELYIYETDELGNETGNKLLCGTYTYQLSAPQERNK